MMLPGPTWRAVDSLMTALLWLFALGLAVLVLLDERAAASMRALAAVL